MSETALALLASLARLTTRGTMDRREDREDQDDDEQLDEREAPSGSWLVACGLLHVFFPHLIKACWVTGDG